MDRLRIHPVAFVVVTALLGEAIGSSVPIRTARATFGPYSIGWIAASDVHIQGGANCDLLRPYTVTEAINNHDAVEGLAGLEMSPGTYTTNAYTFGAFVGGSYGQLQDYFAWTVTYKIDGGAWVQCMPFGEEGENQCLEDVVKYAWIYENLSHKQWQYAHHSGRFDRHLATHEIGHVVGLGHNDDNLSVMPATTDLGNFEITLQTADESLLETIY